MDADKVTVLNCTGLGSRPQEPLALVARISDSNEAPLNPEGGVDLRVLQGLI